MFLIFVVVSADPLKRLVLKKMGIACVGREVRKIISQAVESSGKCTSFSLFYKDASSRVIVDASLVGCCAGAREE